MHQYDWIKPFVGGIAFLFGAWLLQLGIHVTMPNSNVNFVSDDFLEVVGFFGGGLLWGGGVVLLLVGAVDLLAARSRGKS